MNSIFGNVKPTIIKEKFQNDLKDLINKFHMNEQTWKDLLQLEIFQQETTRLIKRNSFCLED
jgi:hypothetical protein